jgi:HD-like signal output (HDOD) protein
MQRIWRRLFERKRAPRGGSALPRKLEVVFQPAKAAKTDAASLAKPGTTFEALASLLKLEVAAPVEVPEAERAADDALASAVVEHYLAHKPGPESFPGLSLQVLNLVAAPSVDLHKLAGLIARDPALSASLLRVANSTLYRGVSATETVRDALARLGLQEVARVASVVSARSLFNPRLRAHFASLEPHFSALFQDAIACALASSATALRLPPAHADRAWLGGLLHDVGKSIALHSICALIEVAKVHPGGATKDRIGRVLESVHLEIGEDVHRAWALPDYLVRLATHHHDAAVPEEDTRELHVVRLISALRDLRTAPSLQARAARELVESAAVLEIDPFELRAIDTELRALSIRASALAAA